MDGIINGVIGSLIVLILSFVLIWLRNKYSLILSKRNSRIPSAILILILVIWVIVGVIIQYLIITNSSLIWLSPIYLILAFSLVYYLWKQRHVLRRFGIRGIDQEIRHGINYKKALSLCKNRLEFLGIGASKLTREEEFEKAIHRCRPEKPIKFLLCKPTDYCLVDAAKRFGVDSGKYTSIVVNSLRIIAELKKRYKNIEVSFYPKFQMFRLMFIDDSICLVSFNVMGEGDGSQLQQLHISKAPEGHREVDSFYYPLERYFDELWESPDTERWNFTDYLES